MTLSNKNRAMGANSGHYAGIFRFFPDVVTLTRASDGFLLDVNEAFEHLTGYLRDEVVGRKITQLGCRLDPDQWREVCRTLNAGGEIRDLETQILCKDGRLSPILMTLRCLEIEGEQCYLAVVRDVSEHKHAEERGREREDELQAKLDTLLSPDEDVSGEEVRQIIDFQQTQELMNSFYKVTRITIGLVDLKGNILVATGYQDICTKFHRLHPQTLANCIESDVYLSQEGLEEENCKIYKCKNNMWDIATPITVAGKHIANLFLGQFFFEDEVPDRKTFTRQAEAYGFDKKEYLAALDRIPRRSKETVQNVMEFYSHLAQMVAELSYRNIRLAKALVERNRAEEALRESEEKFAKSFSATPSILTISTIAEGRYIEVNDAFLRVTGLLREEVIGRTSVELNIWETPETRASFLQTLQEEGKVRELEARFRSKCGELIIGLLSAEVIEIKGERFLLILLNDITERKRAEKALLKSELLLESEKRFRSLFEHMLEGVAYCRMLYDENGCPDDFMYLDVNSAFSELTGFHDVVGKKVSELLPGFKESDPELLEIYGRVASTGQPEKFEIFSKRLSLWRSMSVYCTGKGFFVAVSENITERKRIEAELTESHHKLRKLTAHLNLTRERGRMAFARKVHDELGTSLTLLKFDLAWLKRNHPSDDKTVVERIISMDGLIHECTRTVQRITSELRPSLLDEQGLAATVEWQVKEFEKRSGISCILKIDTAIAQLGQDNAINVYRILQESLSNVMRHSGATSVTVSLAKSGQQLVLQITDNGAGICEQEISAHTSFGILGMEERARLCGGAIAINGIPGNGTTISLSIPI